MEKQTATGTAATAATAELYIINDRHDEQAFMEEVLRLGPKGVYIYDAKAKVEDTMEVCESAYVVSDRPLKLEDVLALCQAKFLDEKGGEEDVTNQNSQEIILLITPDAGLEIDGACEYCDAEVKGSWLVARVMPMSGNWPSITAFGSFAEAKAAACKWSTEDSYLVPVRTICTPEELDAVWDSVSVLDADNEK